MGQIAIQFLPSVVALVLFVGAPWLVYRRLRSRRPTAIAPPMAGDGAGGRIVPVIAAFGGLRGLPWVALASNNLNPRLVIGAAGISFRLIRSRTRPDREIEKVDLRVFGATVNLCFAFRDTPFTFTANIGDIALAEQVLALLAGRVPLSDRAAALIEKR